MRTADPVLAALVQRGQAGLGGAGPTEGGIRAGQYIGDSDLTQGTVGAQVGGQSFSDLLVFETQAALERFKAG
jgi:hypothetical protein